MGAEHFGCAAKLRGTFHSIQITIHRPFIQVSRSSHRVSPLSLPALATCTHAAHSISHILARCLEVDCSAALMMQAFVSGVLLMISIWEAQRSGLNVDVSRHVADVRICLRYLDTYERM